jgi:photosystem II stability/assembly factor-like uncharacterized protein
MDAVWRRPLVSVVLLGALLTGCSHHSGRQTTPTSRTGGSEGTTTTTAPVPSGFVAAWFSTPQSGWAVGEEPCSRPDYNPATCAVVSRTTDGGATWARLGALDTPGPRGALGPEFVSRVRFADAEHGWVYGRQLFATFNGGRRWQAVDLGNPVAAVDAVDGVAYAVVGTCGSGAGNCTAPMRVAEGTVSTGRWRFVSPGFELPQGDVGDLVVNRSGVYALVSGPSAQVLLARTPAGRWERRTPPCARPVLAPISGQDGLVAACLPAGSDKAVELQTSSDGGRSWAVVWQYELPAALTSLAVTKDATIVAVATGELLRTADNGLHFSSVLRTGATPTLQFVDGQHGFVTAGPTGTRQLAATDDAGATWRTLPPPG